jgi:hypothetical protein
MVTFRNCSVVWPTNPSDRELASVGRLARSIRGLAKAKYRCAAVAHYADDNSGDVTLQKKCRVYRTKRRFVLGNLEAALREEPRPGARRKLSGKEEALLVATAGSSPPAGRAR